MALLAKGVYHEERGDGLAKHLEGVPRLLTTGDVSHLLGVSQLWVRELAQRRELGVAAFTAKERKRSQGWEPFLLFEPAEVERYDAARQGNRRVIRREPLQLRLLMGIQGGKK